MKGIVFTEFFDMLESSFGYELVDKLIESSDLPSNGVYTAVGTYDHNEMITLVSNLSKEIDKPIPDLLKLFGKHLFAVFTKGYGHFFEEAKDAFDFLESIENYIHVEVKKLYPEAQLPSFVTKRIGENALEMVYKSERKMSDLAYGLIESTMVYYNTPSEIEIINQEEDGKVVTFLITLQ